MTQLGAQLLGEAPSDAGSGVKGAAEPVLQPRNVGAVTTWAVTSSLDFQHP